MSYIPDAGEDREQAGFDPGTTEGDGPIVGILAHAGTGNLGDEATLATVVALLRERLPNARLQAYTMNPRDTEARHGIKAFPRRRGFNWATARVVDGTPEPEPGLAGREGEGASGGLLLRIRRSLGPVKAPARWTREILRELRFLVAAFRSLRGVDLLVMPGSGQLTDLYGGIWEKPFHAFKWVVLARLRGARVAILAMGAESIDHSISAKLIKWALLLAHRRSFRDPSSRALAEAIGAPRGDPLVPDLVLRTGPGGESGIPPAPWKESLTVGINPLRFGSDGYVRVDGVVAYATYLRELGTLIRWLHARGHRVVLFPTQVRMDPWAIRDLLEALGPEGSELRLRVEVPAVRAMPDLERVLEDLDVIVATRYHGVVWALALRKPVLGIAYEQKTRDLMAMYGMEDLCSDSWRLGAGELIRRFESLEERWKAPCSLSWDETTRVVEAQDRELGEVAGLVG